MKKLPTFVYTLFAIAAAVAAPTANEDFVIAEDAQTFTNAVNAAKAYTDMATNAAVGVAVNAAKAYTDTATNAAVGAANAYTDEAVSDKADAVRASAGGQAVVSCSWWDGSKLLTWNGLSWMWIPGTLGGSRELVYEDGRWEYKPAVVAHGYTNSVPIYGLPASLVLYLGGDSVTLTRTNEVYAAATNEYPVAYMDDVARATNALTAADVGAVPVTRTINGQPLTGDITIASGVTSVNGATGTVTLAASDVGAVPVTRTINGQPLTNDITIDSGVTSVNGATGTVTLAASDVGAVPSSRTVNGQPLTGDVSLSASDVGAYSSTSGNRLAGQVATIGAHLNTEDARFVVTNCNSVTHTPEAYVEIKLPDESWSRIWSEMTRWNHLFDEYLPTNYYNKAAVNAALADKADRAWGFYDSTTGAYAPDGYTWISSEKIAIAANLAYQRTVTTEGAIWVLESNGVVTETGGMTNGFFRISDDEGNSLFEIVKGNKRTVGADASSCQVVAGFTPTKLQIGYSIVSDVHPTLYVCQSLTTQNWKAETDVDCIANVTWSGTSGAYVAQVQGKSAYSSMFVKATYEVGGETYISNAAPVSMQYIMIGGVKYAVGVGTVSGTTVLTLTVAQ